LTEQLIGGLSDEMPNSLCVLVKLKVYHRFQNCFLKFDTKECAAMRKEQIITLLNVLEQS
jgi:hypothetical protein